MQSSAPTIPLGRQIAPGVLDVARQREGPALSLNLLTFLLGVLVPTIMAGLYYGAVASDVFVSEAQFAIRGSKSTWGGGAFSLSSGGSSSKGDSSNSRSSSGSSSSSASSSGASMSSMVSSVLGANSNQDAEIVAAYIKSRALLDKIDSGQLVRGAYARPEFDPLSRLPQGASAEEMLSYWRAMTTATVDNQSGIVTLRVSAFTAQEAKRVAQAALVASEELVNEMSRRRRQDAMAAANEEMARTEQRLQAARVAVQAFRNRSGQIDPMKQSDAVDKLLSGLRLERIQLENQLAASRQSLTSDSPTIQVLQSRLRAISDQIAGFERTMTGRNDKGQTFSGAMSQYEGLEIEKDLAQRLSLVAQSGYERARITAEQRQVYLTAFVDPTLPDRPTYPRRVANVIVTFVCCFALWSIFALLRATVKDSFI